jgi:hypothetical protein
LKAPEHQSVRQLATLHQVSQANQRLYRAFLLREELRLLYHLPDPELAPAHLDAWLAWAARSQLKPFVRLAHTLRAHREGILAAIRLGLTNGRLEGLNSKIRLISHRSFGFHSAPPLIALVYLCCGGITSAAVTGDCHAGIRGSRGLRCPRRPDSGRKPKRAGCIKNLRSTADEAAGKPSMGHGRECLGS